MPDIPSICTETEEGYAKLLTHNFDTVQECYCTVYPDGFVDRLNAGQKEAQDKHEGQGVTFLLNGELFQIWSGGSGGGNTWVLEDNELQFHFKRRERGWNITVRYLAAGLWGEGITNMIHRVNELLTGEGFTPYTEGDGVRFNGDWSRLSRVDYAMDFFSPKFSLEQLPGLIAGNLVLTAGVKAGLVFTSRRNETITIGMQRNGVQIQIYDKGKEIIDKPGKEWMYDVWEEINYGSSEDEFYKVPLDENGKKRARDIWRVEIRLGKDFLKDRNIRTWEEFLPEHQKLLSEAMMRRRMVVPKINGRKIPKNDDHKERWDLHPLWAEAWQWAGAAQDYVPKGRMVTGARVKYIEMLEKQQAGVGRSLSVAKTGGYDEESALDDAEKSVEIALKDEKHDDKVDKAQMRQQWLDDAK